MQRKAIEKQSQSARELVVSLGTEVDNTLRRIKAACVEQIAQQVGDLRTQAQTSVSSVNEKLAEIKSLFKVSHVVPKRRRGQADTADHRNDGAPGEASGVRSRVEANFVNIQ